MAIKAAVSTAPVVAVQVAAGKVVGAAVVGSETSLTVMMLTTALRTPKGGTLLSMMTPTSAWTSELDMAAAAAGLVVDASL
jgi:hypothetical protein